MGLNLEINNMILPKNNIEERKALLLEAFKDNQLKDEVIGISNELYDKVKAWVESLNRLDPRITNVFSVQSRIKDADTFEEKLFRKNYIHDWDVTDDKEENKQLIKRSLTDLVGIRINCFFAHHELRLYNALQARQEELTDCVLNFDENTEMANGHPIYKFSGIYKDQYRFEVQIKSIVHNVWGEVEHKTVYKNPTFDGYIDKKREIVEALYEVLLASDKELFSVFNMGETEEHLIRSLFFCKTKDIIKERCNTNILAYHYQRYFNVFKAIDPYRQYVIDAMSGKGYVRNHIVPDIDHHYDKLKDAVLKEFPLFFISSIYEIDNLINKHESFDTFLYYFLKTVFPDIAEIDAFDEEYNRKSAWDEDETDDEAEAIAEDAADSAEAELLKNYIENLDGLLLKCRIKKDSK